MSVRLQMLQVARRAPKMLGESAELVREFLLRQQNDDGGFTDRNGQSDLYYTVFAVDGLLALEPQPSASVPAQSPYRKGLESYVKGLVEIKRLDFVHLCCLARCLAALEMKSQARPVLERLEAFRAADGGYNPAPASEAGTAYGAFLALGAFQDAGADLPAALRLVQSLKLLETDDGAWANDRRVRTGSTNATAAAVTLLRNLEMPVNAAVAGWLLARRHAGGGFCASPAAPMPDLLSTATALHALAGLETPLADIRDPCLDFIDTLWTNDGAFYGHWGDDHLDCEYTFYALLALGHLSF
jgi:prenyltransferase beta subunit